MFENINWSTVMINCDKLSKKYSLSAEDVNYLLQVFESLVIAGLDEYENVARSCLQIVFQNSVIDSLRCVIVGGLFDIAEMEDCLRALSVAGNATAKLLMLDFGALGFSRRGKLQIIMDSYRCLLRDVRLKRVPNRAVSWRIVNSINSRAQDLLMGY